MSLKLKATTTGNVSLRPNSELSLAELSRMADAGVKVVDCIRDLHASGTNLVNEVLRGSADFTEWDHYPSNDVQDPKSHAQYYFHAHSQDDRDAPDFGHFHTFMRPKGMPGGVSPAAVPGYVFPAGENDALSHLVAISMSPTGMPERLFTTNRWVTGEVWYKAADVIAMLNRFRIDIEKPSRPLNQWLTAMFVLFRPQIEHLLIERDRAIERWRLQHPNTDVFEDRILEIASAMEISLYDHIEQLDRQIEAASHASCSDR